MLGLLLGTRPGCSLLLQPFPTWIRIRGHSPSLLSVKKALPGLVLHKTVDLDTVRKVLEDPSTDFRRGMIRFLVVAFAHIFDPPSLYKLAGSTIC